MRRLMAVMAVAVCAALTAGAAEDEKYKSKDGKYAVQFPNGAKVKTGDNLAHCEMMGQSYFTMFMDLPDNLKALTVKMRLDIAEKSAVAASAGKLESSKDIEIGKNKYPGRELVIDKDGNKRTHRIILDGARVYVIAIGGTNDFYTSKEGKAFLDSFEIAK